MKLLVSIVALALIVPSVASAHLVARPEGSTLAARLASQDENLRHSQYVCRRGGGEHRRWACHAVRWLTRERGETAARIERTMGPRAAIDAVFGRYADQAWRVALCEGGRPIPSVNARNGQYLGMFQMGRSERKKWGHGPTPIEQARAAYAYFAASGYDWSPWACKP